VARVSGAVGDVSLLESRGCRRYKKERWVVTGSEKLRRIAMKRSSILLPLVSCLVAAGLVVSGVWADAPSVDPPLRQAWKTVLPGGEAVRSLVAEDGIVYLLTNEGIVHALSAGDGQSLWQTSGWLAPETRRCPYDPPKLRSVTHSAVFPQTDILLAVDGDSVIAAICAGWENYVTDQQLLLLDKAMGQLRGTWPVIGGRLEGVHDGTIVIASEGVVYGVSLTEQREVWRISREPAYYPAYFMAALDGLLFLRTNDEEGEPAVSAYSTKDGALLWESSVGENWAIEGLDDGLVFAIRTEEGYGEGKELFALDAETGDVVWHTDLSNFEGYVDRLGLIVQDGKLYAYNRSLPGRIAAFEASTGERIWDVAPQFGVQDIRVLGDRLYCVGDNDGDIRLYALNAEDGQEVWSGLSDRALLLGPVLHGVLFVATSQQGTPGGDAVLTAFRERS
jgi:outer membrane protein assembly factor BamB